MLLQCCTSLTRQELLTHVKRSFNLTLASITKLHAMDAVRQTLFSILQQPSRLVTPSANDRPTLMAINVVLATVCIT